MGNSYVCHGQFVMAFVNADLSNDLTVLTYSYETFKSFKLIYIHNLTNSTFYDMTVYKYIGLHGYTRPRTQ